MKQEKQTFNKDIVEFVTVAVQFCLLAENVNQIDRKEFVDKMIKILPLLYLKATMLPNFDNLDDVFIEQFVEEENYNIVRENIALILGQYDDFLDVFVEDMKYSDTPILSTVSENIADIYQEVKDFVMNYKVAANDEVLFVAVAKCNEDFKFSWGQKLVNVLRPLHEMKYKVDSFDEEIV